MVSAETFAQFPYEPQHPLDALTSEELDVAKDILQRNGMLPADALIPTLSLIEPEKSFVRAWTPGKDFARRALAVVRSGSQTREITLDLKADSLLQSKLVSGHPFVMDREWTKARDAFQADPRFLEALKKRGLAMDGNVFCTPNSAGLLAGEDFGGRRVVKIPCFSSKDKLHSALARPIEGLMGVVDSETGEVLAVHDKEAVALPPAPVGYGEKLPPRSAAIKPQVLSAPNGSNYSLSGNLNVNWLNWSFHVRSDKRAGVILSLLRFQDGQKLRDVAYQVNVSEMFVPYMDPNATWAYRTFMDVGEFGLGYLISPLEPGVDCPDHATFVNLTFPNDLGGSYIREGALCIFERNTGDPAWRHYSSGNQLVDGMPQIELVVRHVPTLGNYDYVIDYVFTPQGNVRLRVGATGFDAIKSTAAADMNDETAAADTRHGNLIAPYTIAPFHDHYFNFKIDLDVDGPGNTLVKDEFVQDKLDGPRKSLWRVESSTLENEGPVLQSHAPASFRVVNPSYRNSLQQQTGYWLNAHHDAQSMMSDDDLPQLRAQFSKHQYWVTRYKANEQWAAGDYPNLSTKDLGLPKFSADAESIANEDLVVWYTMGFRHVTRPEDFPILPTFWHEMTLRPMFFFDRDPSSTFNAGLPEE